ncbi:gamma-glutamyl hydrolase-like [Liolophura sinensis]|uniref:gamma-glutamyl hydrolase-like n=1 Tax=Liolophura sinensis TaxID=3198878 RepID=UPI0031592CF3
MEWDIGLRKICMVAVVLHIGNYGVLALNNRPIIGVLSQTSDGDFKPYGDSYILSSYIKYLESGGARVVPIRIYQSDDYYRSIFNSINGVLFPGGGANLTTSGYAQAGRILFDLAIEANKAGDFFPVWGTCLGFQFLTALVAKKVLLGHFDAENLPLPLDLISPDYQKSEIFGQAPQEIIDALKTENVTANSHQFGITPEVFKQNDDLRNFFRILSTNKDRKGGVFVSSMEGYKYPVWGVQFHPEKNVFIWYEKYKWLHNEDAVKVTQYFANFFVNQARHNNHSFSSEEAAAAAVIENYSPVYLKSFYPYESLYVFNFTSNDNTINVVNQL